jgi:hypothetical protein
MVEARCGVRVGTSRPDLWPLPPQTPWCPGIRSTSDRLLSDRAQQLSSMVGVIGQNHIVVMCDKNSSPTAAVVM